MASLAVAATRSLIRCGSARTSLTACPPNLSAHYAPGGFASLGKGMGNRAFGGLQTNGNSAGRAGRNSLFCRASSSAAVATSPKIKVGEKLPEAEFTYLDKDDQVQTIKFSELTEGKKVVLFAVPAAFSPTCSAKHVPAFARNADELKARGIDTIACVSVNDVFVLKAWGSSLGVADKVLFLSDGNGTFTEALGAQVDMSGAKMGVRSRRYSLLADNGVLKQWNLEEGGAYTISGPETILKSL